MSLTHLLSLISVLLLQPDRFRHPERHDRSGFDEQCRTKDDAVRLY